MGDDHKDNQSKAERAAYYRRMALDALKHAEQTKDENRREHYVHLARSWHALAVKVEGADEVVQPESALPPIVESSLPTGALKH